MTVRPVSFNADGSVDVVNSADGHSGTIPAAEIVWGKSIDGAENHNYIVLACPDGCGTSSVHPVGGGAAPVEVQEMFVRKVDGDGCCCAQVKARSAGGTTQEAINHVRLLVAAMDGPGRWQVDEDVLAAALV